MGKQERIFASDEAAEAAAEIAALIARSRAAQAQIEHYTQEQVDALIRAMVWAVARPGVAEKIARHTVEETQLGNYEGKYLKIFRKTRAALMDIIDDKSVGVIEEYPERKIVMIAKPVGVIGALSPSTNPEATPVIKAINAVKGRNSIIIAPHPRAKLTNKMVCDLMRDGARQDGRAGRPRHRDRHADAREDQRADAAVRPHPRHRRRARWSRPLIRAARRRSASAPAMR